METTVKWGDRQRIFDLALACVVFLFPLLPAASDYLSLPRRAWIDLGILLAAVAAACSLLAGGGLEWRQLVGRWRQAGLRPVASAWIAFAAVVTAALAVGIAAENLPWTPPFRANLMEFPASFWTGMDQRWDPLYPLRVWITQIEGCLLFLLLGTACLAAPNPPRRCRALLFGSVAGLAVTGGIAVIQFFTGIALHPYWVRVNPDLVRAHSTLEDPNALGSYLVLMIPVAIGLAFDKNTGPVARRLSLLAALFGVAGVVATVSRAAWVALALGALLALNSSPRSAHAGRRKLQRLGRVAAIVGAGALLLWVGLRVAIPETTARPRPGSPLGALASTLDPRTPLPVLLKHRTTWWSAAMEMIDNEPLTGVGLGRFPRRLEELRPDAPALENAHNFFLQIGAECGLPGMIAIIALLTSLVGGVRAPVESGGRVIGLGVMTALAGFVITNLTGHPLLLPSQQAVLATIAASSLVLLHTRSDRGDETTPSPAATPTPTRTGPRLWTACLIGIVLISSTASIIRAHHELAQATAASDRWGYTWGLYAEEIDPGGPYRWTRERALLMLRAAPSDTHLEVEFAVTTPWRDGERARVDFEVDGRNHTARYDRPTWQTTRLPLPAASDSLVLLRILVKPAFVPASIGESTDQRQLGIMIRPPRLVDSESVPASPPAW